MPNVTTAELVARAKATADMRDNFVTPAQWMYWASQERLSLDLLLAQSGWPQGFAMAQINIATGAATGDYTVSTSNGLLAIVAVYEVSSSGYTRRLKHQDNIQFTRQLGGSAAKSTSHARYFRVKTSGDTVYINMFPEPLVSETYDVAYIDHPLRLTLDASPATGYANSVTYPMGWEERIVLGMARRALVKEESSTSEVDKEIQLWEGRIEEACWNRVLGEAPAVRNVDAEERGWTQDRSYPPYHSWFWL